jgi:hypothetical protein
MSELKSEPILKPIESAKPVAVASALAAVDAMSEAEVKQLKYELERREKPELPTWDEKKQAEGDGAAKDGGDQGDGKKGE